MLAGRELTDRSSGALDRVAAVLGGELGWDQSRVELEIQSFLDEAASEGIAVPLAGPA